MCKLHKKEIKDPHCSHDKYVLFLQYRGITVATIDLIRPDCELIQSFMSATTVLKFQKIQIKDDCSMLFTKSSIGIFGNSINITLAYMVR